MKKKGETAKNALRFEEILSELPEKYVREVFAEELGAEAAEKNKKTARRSSARSLNAPAWLRPVAACLAVLLLGGLVVFSIPVVNNIISRRAPAELPGTDVAEADTTAEQEETDAPEETEVNLLDKKFATYPGYPEMSFNDILAVDIKDLDGLSAIGGIIKEEDIQKIQPGMTFLDLMEIGIFGYNNTPLDEEALLAIDNGKVLLIVREYYPEDINNMFKERGWWDYEHDWPVWNVESIEFYNTIRFENPIKEIIEYDDPDRWDLIVRHAIRQIFDHQKNEIEIQR